MGHIYSTKADVSRHEIVCHSSPANKPAEKTQTPDEWTMSGSVASGSVAGGAVANEAVASEAIASWGDNTDKGWGQQN